MCVESQQKRKFRLQLPHIFASGNASSYQGTVAQQRTRQCTHTGVLTERRIFGILHSPQRFFFGLKWWESTFQRALCVSSNIEQNFVLVLRSITLHMHWSPMVEAVSRQHRTFVETCHAVFLAPVIVATSCIQHVSLGESEGKCTTIVKICNFVFQFSLLLLLPLIQESLSVIMRLTARFRGTKCTTAKQTVSEMGLTKMMTPGPNLRRSCSLKVTLDLDPETVMIKFVLVTQAKKRNATAPTTCVRA